MSQEELDQLEKNNRLEAFDFLLKSDSISQKALESLRTFLLMIHQKLRRKIS